MTLATLHYALLNPSAFTELNATAGYPTSNLASSSIRRPWLSTLSANSTNDAWVQFDFGSNQGIAAIAVQSCLQASGSVLTGTGTPPATTYGTIDTSTVVTDHHGIRKGSWSGAATARYVRCDFTNAVEARGAGVYASYASALMELGAMYVFGSSMALPKDARVGSEVDYLYPQTRENLPNGQTVVLGRGAPRARIRLRFGAAASADIEKIARIARAGLCWLDLGVANDRTLQWPVRFVEDKTTRTLSRPNPEGVQLTFEEVA